MTNTLYIIDGHAQIYRAYFAVTALSSPSGEPTNATFGFTSMLLKLLRDRKPTHVVLALDAGAAARLAMDANYKAQRKPMPEDMPLQIARIEQMVETLGIPILKVDGFEADDVIATLVRQVRSDPAHAETPIYMCSKDKDLDQLIDGKVRLYDIQTNDEIDGPALLAKKGYLPTQARDVLALTGDAVDNIPGIPGVGPKTAAKWIAEYGTIENLIAHAGDIKGKIGEAFRANLAVLEQSRKLVELDFAVPVSLDWEAAKVKLERLPALAPIFRDLGFNRLLGTLEELASSVRGTLPMSTTAASTADATATAKPAEASGRRAKTTPPAESTGGLFDALPESTAAAGVAPAPVATDVPEVTDEATGKSGVELPASGLLPSAGEYHLVNTPEKMDAMLADLRADLQSTTATAEVMHGWLSVDTETDALGAMRSNLCGISLSAKPGKAYYIAIRGVGECLDMAVVREKLGPLLADPSVKKIGQNLKYDINSLRIAGLPLKGIYLDTMVASYVLDSSRLSHGMDALAADLLGVRTIPISDLIGKGAKQKSFAEVPLELATEYAAEDADITLRLAHKLFPQLEDPQLRALLFDLEMPLVQVLADMEFAGVTIDAESLAQMSKVIAGKLVELGTQIRSAAGRDFNFDSPKQLGDVLFNTLGLPVVKRTKTGPSTDIEVLEELADKHPVPKLIVEYRQLTKLKNTYLDTLAGEVNARTGRVHASFNQTVAATGRLSSSDPNLQNIPIKTEIGREIRRAFVARDREHVLITADYSQIELRMLAHYCGEPALREAFAANHDVHRVVAAEIFKVSEEQVTSEMRGVAKTVNFGIIYGQTGFGLSKVLKIPQQQASDFISAYKKRFPKIEGFSQQCIQEASLKGYVTTILGRRRAIPDINSPNPARRQFGMRAAMNSVIQGSAADLIKKAMVNVHQKLCCDGPAQLLMQIHDELVLECRAEKAEEIAAIVRREMETALTLEVPLKVELAWAENWLEGK